MEYKTIAGIKVPAIGYGTWTVGGKWEADTSDDANEINAIKEAIKNGVTHIDTAEIYSGGHAEEIVGEAIKEFDREKLFITSKVYPDNLGYEDVLKAAEGSLKRIGIEYLDLYLIHAYNEKIPLAETMKAMDELVSKGSVKNIGVSNFSVTQMKEAQALTKNKIVANQIQYNLIIRDKGLWSENMESEIIPYCQENDIIVIAWAPLQKGRLAASGFEVLDSVCDKYNKTPSQVALNWLISKKNIVVISKANKKEHLMDNLGAIGWKLEQEDIKRLDETEFKDTK